MGGKGLAEKDILEIIRLHEEEHRTIKSLAQSFGVSESTVSRWLIKNTPYLTTLIVIIQLFPTGNLKNYRCVR